MRAQLAVSVALAAVVLTACSPVDDLTPEELGYTTEAPPDAHGGTLPASPAAGAATSPVGTRENPAPLGTPVTLSEDGHPAWEVTLSSPVLNADAAVAAFSPVNDPAPAGMQYATVMVSAKRLADGPGTPIFDLA